jgi:hypothetical protein
VSRAAEGIICDWREWHVSSWKHALVGCLEGQIQLLESTWCGVAKLDVPLHQRQRSASATHASNAWGSSGSFHPSVGSIRLSESLLKFERLWEANVRHLPVTGGSAKKKKKLRCPLSRR